MLKGSRLGTQGRLAVDRLKGFRPRIEGFKANPKGLRTQIMGC